MRQVFLNKGIIALKEVCEPILNDHSIMVSVYHSLIIPETELSIISQSQQDMILRNVPSKIKKVFNAIATKNFEDLTHLIKKVFYGEIKSLGHSCSGKVIAVGKKVTQFRSGDYVACVGNGFASHADMVCIPENFAIKLSNKSMLQESSFIALGALAFEIVKKAQLQIGQTVCIVGLDLLGQLTAQIAKLSGCKVIVIDDHEPFLKKATDLSGAIALQMNSENLEQHISYLTNHQGVDCSIITKHSNKMLEQVVNVSKQQGKIVLCQYEKPVNLNSSRLYIKEITIINVPCAIQDEFFLSSQHVHFKQKQNNTAKDYHKSMDSFIHLLESGLIATKPLISHSLSIDDAKDAYEVIQNKDVMGLVLNFLPKPEQRAAIKHIPTTFVPAKKDSVNVGIIGIGDYSENTLMPILSKIKQVTIETAADKNIIKSLNVAQVYGARKTTLDEQQVLQDEAVDVVFINTLDTMHCQKAIKAMDHGKAVFLEKPMATDMKQLILLYHYLEKNKQARFCVNYNRSHAPFIKKIETFTKTRLSPIMISYRVNVGFINKQERSHLKMGFGELLGEACHIIEMFLFLVGQPVIAVAVESLKPSKSYLFPTDNFTVQISFLDGSICTLLYTSLGHIGMGKERMELYFDSKAIVMEDYTSLEGFGLPFVFNEHVKQANTGSEALINSFLRSIKEENYVSPVSIERLYKATELTLIIDELALKGGGEHLYKDVKKADS